MPTELAPPGVGSGSNGVLMGERSSDPGPGDVIDTDVAPIIPPRSECRATGSPVSTVGTLDAGAGAAVVAGAVTASVVAGVLGATTTVADDAGVPAVGAVTDVEELDEAGLFLWDDLWTTGVPSGARAPWDEEPVEADEELSAARTKRSPPHSTKPITIRYRQFEAVMLPYLRR